MNREVIMRAFRRGSGEFLGLYVWTYNSHTVNVYESYHDYIADKPSNCYTIGDCSKDSATFEDFFKSIERIENGED
jgi:hypothetical protein